jgi:mono/diheme cytochrome c family protein
VRIINRKEGKAFMSSDDLPELTDEEIETVRAYIETTKPTVVSDEVRAVVERYLPELKSKLPKKTELDGWVV